jgi:exonuclease SbcC
MKISKINIEKLYGIEQLELDGKSIELTGSNGVGKSSVLDAIRLALTNNSKRKYIVKNGQKEGKIYVKLDDGTTIERKKRTDKSDYKSIKDGNGNDIASPESFLKDIFTPLQLEPVEFLSMSEQEQNRILLNLIKFDKDKKQFITEKFGEEISWVDYDNSILEILNEIQSKDGQYYQAREDINRNIRNEQAIITDIAKDIPEGYDVNKWRNFTLSEKYEELNKKKTFNENIDKSIAYKEDYDNKIKQIETTESNTLLQIEANKVEEKNKINTEIQDLKNRILLLEKELENVDTKYEKVIAEAKSQTAAEKAKLEENIKIANEWAAKTKEETETIENELKIAEEMKGHINEYDRMMEKKSHIDLLKEQSESLTNKIELARNLPGEILKEVEIPVKNLTVVDGVPLVNNLAISNLSEGEKLQLCVDVTLANPDSLKIILIDGTEKLSEANRNKLYEICKEKGLQILATRTTDSNELNIVEL